MPGTVKIWWHDGAVRDVRFHDLPVVSEPELGFDGIAASHPPVDGMAGEEPFVIADVPVGLVRRLRENGAEVWPGTWTGEHVRVELAK